MIRYKDTFESKLKATSRVADAKALFSNAIRDLGYDHFDALSMHAAMLASPYKASRYFVCDYYDGDPWKYLPNGWPADDELTAQVSRSSTPIDYLDYLKTCDTTASILLQRGMLKTCGVKKAWLFPLNTLGFLRCVTCYMVGGKENQEIVFRETRDELFGWAALLIDHLEELYIAHSTEQEGVLVVNKMPVSFSEIEMSVLQFLSRGHSNQEIADMMDISIHTVRYHLKRIYRKINVSTRSEAVVAAISHGYVQR